MEGWEIFQAAILQHSQIHWIKGPTKTLGKYIYWLINMDLYGFMLIYIS